MCASLVSVLPDPPGLKDDRERRESGYFSLGRAAGARSFRDNSPPAPFRHLERGHPLFNNRNLEPKDFIPFRNPNLGVASERPIPDNLNDDLPVELPPPDPYEIAVEVEAQVGPRSPSPTPFKIAESLASTGRKGFSNSYDRGNSSSSQVSSFQQSGRYDSSRQVSALQSRSSSPSRGNLPFRRTESTTSLSRYNLGSGARSQGLEPGSRSSLQNKHAQRVESGTLPRNFKTFAGSVKSQSSTISDFRGALRKTEVSGSFSGRSRDGRNLSPSRRDCNTPGQMSLHKTEITSNSSQTRGRETRTSSPSRKISDSLRDSSSPSRRNFSSSSQSLLRKSESATSLNGRGHPGRCGSPIREGYDIESQVQLRNSTARNGMNDDYEDDRPIMPLPQRSYHAPSRSILRKTESSTAGGSRGRDSRSSSPGRRSYETPGQYQLRKTDASGSLNVRSHESRNSSPSRRSYEAPSQSLLRKSDSSVRNRESHSLLPSKKDYDVPDPRLPRTRGTSSSLNNRSFANSSVTGDSPGYSVFRHATNTDSNRSPQRKNTYNDAKESKHSARSWRSSSHSVCSSSLSRSASPSRQTTNGSRAACVTLDTPKSPSSIRSGVGRHVREDRCSSPHDKRPSHRALSPSYSPPIQIQRHTSSQSSMDSSESGHLSAESTGRNREEYAMMADLPKVKKIHQMEGPDHLGRPHNQQSSRRQELFKPARSAEY